MNQYEAMFLFDPTFGSSIENCEAEIKRLMERAEAEIILCRKWDERRLAYKIKGRKRGVYMIVYFNAPPGNIVKLERDSQLAENILRLLVLRAEGLTEEMMEQAARTTGAVQPTGTDGAKRDEKRSGESPGAATVAKDGAKDGAGSKAASAKEADSAKSDKPADGKASDDKVSDNKASDSKASDDKPAGDEKSATADAAASD